MNRRSLLAVTVTAALVVACAGDGGTPPLDLSGTRIAVPPVPKWAELRRLLAESQYEALDETLERYRAASLWDIEQGEEPLQLAYESFATSSPLILRQLNRWVWLRPKSWHALTARAYCNLEMGHDARGTGWAKDLTDRQRAEMREFFRAAANDARAALELQPRNIGPHYVLVTMARHNTAEFDFDAQMRNALAAFPASYTLRLSIALGLQPRWRAGTGNYAPIERFAKDSQEHAAINPRLRQLFGMPYWARGQDLSTDGRHAEAVGMYNAALLFGEAPVFLRARAHAAARNHDFPLAFRDAKRVRELTPQAGDGTGLDGTTADVVKTARAWAAGRLDHGDVAAAIATLDMVLEQTPDDAFIMVVRGVAHCRLGQLAPALKDFERSLALEPDSEDVPRMQSACVASGGKPVEAIRGQQAEIVKASGNGKTQHDLAALYSLVSDVPSAIVAYRHACELGYRDACRRLVDLQEVADRNPTLSWPPELRGRRELHAQEQMTSAADYDAFMAKLGESAKFAAGGPPVRFVERPLPRFPAWARAVKGGSVEVMIYFNADGTVAGARVKDSEPQGYFELAAITAVLQWRIEPRPTGLKASQRIDFRLPPDREPDPDRDLLIAMLDSGAAARTPAPLPR